jgi:hypothetical protein
MRKKNLKIWRAGFRDDQIYVVRPDGYIGLIAPLGEALVRLEDYVTTHGIATR